MSKHLILPSESDSTKNVLSHKLITSSSGVDLESEVLKSMHERLLKDFMDVLIMARLRNNDMSGYDVIAYIHKKFNILISSGTVYSLLYSMERDGLIKGKRNSRKRTYTLTGKGKETIKVIQNANGTTQNFIAMLLQAK